MKYTGTKHCHDCKHFFDGNYGQYCTKKIFPTQYTENCTEKKVMGKEEKYQHEFSCKFCGRKIVSENGKFCPHCARFQ